MDNNLIQPVGINNAIEVMAIGIEWASPPISDEQIALIQEAYEKSADLKSFFSAFSQVQAFVFQATTPPFNADLKNNSEPGTPPQFFAKNGGFDLQRKDENDKFTWVCSVRPDFLSVNCSAYTRWKSVKPQALAILKPLVEAAIASGAGINAIGLQYQDSFKLPKGTSSEVHDMLFRKDGNFLPRHLIGQDSFWHCHQGWFSKTSENHRVLNNIAIDITEVDGLQFARIGGQHRVFSHTSDGSSPKKIALIDSEQILEFLHQENINAINSILSNTALEAIGCKVEK